MFHGRSDASTRPIRRRICHCKFYRTISMILYNLRAQARRIRVMPWNARTPPISLCKSTYTHLHLKFLLPLVRADDLGIQAGEVLVDWVLLVRSGFLSRASIAVLDLWCRERDLPLRPCKLEVTALAQRSLVWCILEKPSSLRGSQHASEGSEYPSRPLPISPVWNLPGWRLTYPALSS